MVHDEVRFAGDARPLFVIGAPRSGTTFLHQVVNSHPHVIISDELRVVSWLFQEARKLEEGFEKNGNPYPFNHGKDFAAYLVRNAEGLIRPFYLTLAETVPGKRNIKYWGDKFPHYDEIIDKMPSVFPNARFIFIHRDLRDVICSVKNGHGWDVTLSTEHVATIYTRYISKLTELFAKGVMSPDAVFHVGYEQFTYQTWTYAREIFDWLSLEVDPSMQAVVDDVRATQSHSVRESVGCLTHKVQFVPSESLGRWKKDLSDREIEQMNAALELISSEMAEGQRMVESMRRS